MEVFMFVAILSGIAAVSLGFGAVQEIIVRGLQNRELQPALVGIAGATVSVLLLVAGVAYVQRKSYARWLCIAAAMLSLAVHGYAALPPHVNVGFPALLVAMISAVVLLVAAMRDPQGQRSNGETVAG